MEPDRDIKNIIFDIGNVIVKWSPKDIVKCALNEHEKVDEHVSEIFFNDIWYDLNLGKLTEEKAIDLYTKQTAYSKAQMQAVFKHVKETQKLIDDTVDILATLHNNNYHLFALSDNVKEIISHLKQKYSFWQYFSGTVISADIGMMKPCHDIFHYTLNKFNLNADETLFIDDYFPNINAASELNIHTIQFLNAVQCKRELTQYGVSLGPVDVSFSDA